MLLISAHPTSATGTRDMLAARQASSLASKYLYHGEATYYSDTIPADGAAQFTCSFPYLSPWAQKYFVAINEVMWDQGRNCGRCVKVTCTDPECNGKPDVIAFIVDMCPTCSNGDLDFAMSPWSDLSGITPGRVQISWNFTSCHNYITDTIKYAPKQGSNKYWQAFHFSNSRYRPYWVKLNGKELKMSNENFWIHDAEASAPFKFEMMSWGGSTVSFEINDLFMGADTGVQFLGYFANARSASSSNKPKKETTGLIFT
ncbi:hypothetical protein Ndes2526B_g01385 [Nannochloris sp. 'desiccata']